MTASAESTLLVSAVVVVRNGERFLARALQSAVDQTRHPDEIIVIDGQSTDRTPEIARSFPGVRYIRQPDFGIANARNLGIEAARGEFIAFLDADDLWLPDKLAVQIDYMLAHPELAYSTTWLRLFYEPGCPPLPGFRPEGFTVGQAGCFPGTMLARRSIFSQVGPFDARFVVAFEVDWFARAQDTEVPAATLCQVLLRKRIHSHNNSADRGRFRREWFVVIRESLERKRSRIFLRQREL